MTAYNPHLSWEDSNVCGNQLDHAAVCQVLEGSLCDRNFKAILRKYYDRFLFCARVHTDFYIHTPTIASFGRPIVLHKYNMIATMAIEP